MRGHRKLLLLRGKTESLLRDALAGKEVLQKNAEHGQYGQSNPEHPPVRIGSHPVDGAVSSGHEHKGLKQDRHKDTGTDAGRRHHRGVGKRRQKASLVPVPCGQGDHGTVGCVVAGISDGIKEVKGYGDPDHFHQIVCCLRIVSAGGKEQQNDCHCHHRRGEQQVRSGLSCGRPGVVDQLSDKEISCHHDDRRNDRQHHGKYAELAVGQANDVRVIPGQIGAENRIGQHRAQRRDQVPDQHFRDLHVIGSNFCLQNRIIE